LVSCCTWAAESPHPPRSSFLPNASKICVASESHPTHRRHIPWSAMLCQCEPRTAAASGIRGKGIGEIPSPAFLVPVQRLKVCEDDVDLVVLLLT